ncbi:MAG: tRNA 2-selenouridine(34) synthase MnmH [Candidatus Syntrophonatronum acetioxidans]|uniref:tRNA 2-selenouridine(34) synthase MnmH n=1 Tax=Candidatus Syntrophonatronum acetioxidans TaxID=1795816 RepID=A0A424YDM2_9FIRM|nr:MAG: tRNA 2-selenouridine(34) synthase MnmH [Candidatus Syntrophonatronum acetioxidans]
MKEFIITAEDLFSMEEYPIIVDVRSPSEYARASIPGAINLPLFNDYERAKIGITYKEKGILEAKLKGVEIFSPRLYSFVKRIAEEVEKENRPVVFYCWRGGMRSKLIVKIIDFLGLQVYQLQGGYKGYRRYIYHQLSNFKFEGKHLIVLNGFTGSGKTEALKRLSSRWPVLDLEGMARHRGSVFGHLGLEKPRSQKDFEALLWHDIYSFRYEPVLIVEGEGRKIGPLYLPPFLVEAIKEGSHVLLQASLNTRAQRILNEYACLDKELVKEQAREPLTYLTKRLGREKISRLLELLEEEDFYNVAKILCREHYDQQYAESKIGVNEFELVVNAENLDEAVDNIDKYINRLLVDRKTAAD